MNLLIATGNLGNDCAIKATPSGTTVCEFPLAIKSGYGQSEKTTWVRCALFGKRAEGNLPQYLTKGAQVCISGEMSLHEWDKQDGTKGCCIQVMVDKLDLIGGAREAGVRQPAPQPAQQQPAHAGGFADFDDEIGF